MTPFPRCALWEHLQRNCVPTCLLKIQILYDADEYVLVDRTKQARVQPPRGVKQEALLHLCFCLCTSMMLIA